jgi:release factor glutamine methyltransferase
MNYELIVSNPPYISCAQIKYLQPEIKSEPRLALDGGKDGLDFYRRIINQAGGYLKKDGFLILEMGFKQREAIEKIFQKSKNFKIIEIIKDYNNIDRVIVSRKYKS